MGRKSDKPTDRTFVRPEGGVIAVLTKPKGDGQWRAVLKQTKSGISDGQMKIVLDQMAKHGQLATAADFAGVTLGAVKKLLKDDEEFAEAMEHVSQVYGDSIVHHLQDLAHNGVEERKYHPETGQLISETTRYDSKLIVKELERRDKEYTPQKKVDHTHSLGTGVLAIPQSSETIDEYNAKHGRIIEGESEEVVEEAVEVATLADAPTPTNENS